MLNGRAMGWFEERAGLDGTVAVVTGGAGGLGEAITLDSAAKAGVAHFARSLALEVAPDGIRVNNVAPDITPTPNMGDISADSSSLGDPVGARIAVPMGRVGVPTDVSGCVV